MLLKSDADFSPQILASESDGSYVQRNRIAKYGRHLWVVEKFVSSKYDDATLKELEDLFITMAKVGIGPKLLDVDITAKKFVFEDLKTETNRVLDGRIINSLDQLAKAGILTSEDVDHIRSLYEIFKQGRMHLDFSPKNFAIVKDEGKPARLYMLDNLRSPGTITTIAEIKEVKARIIAAAPFEIPNFTSH